MAHPPHSSNYFGNLAAEGAPVAADVNALPEAVQSALLDLLELRSMRWMN